MNSVSPLQANTLDKGHGFCPALFTSLPSHHPHFSASHKMARNTAFKLFGFPFICDWTEVEFSDAIAVERICTSCKLIASKMVKMPCHHVLCPFCYSVNKNHDFSVICPSCDASFNVMNIRKDRSSLNYFAWLKVNCINKPNGCNYTGPLSQLQAHLNCCNFFSKMGKTCTCHRKSAHETNDEAAANGDASHLDNIERFGIDVKSLQNSLENLKKVVNELSVKSANSEETAEKLAALILKHQKDLGALESKCDHLKEDTRRLLDENRDELAKMKASVLERDERLAALTKNVALLKSKVGTQMFEWKVSNYSQLVKEFEEAQDYKFESGDIYVGSPGYRIQVYGKFFKQDSKNKIFVGFYMKLMSGPYDDMIEWPYSKKTAFILIDQVQNRHHRKCAFVPSQVKPQFLDYFTRPRGYENKGYGFHTFISVEDIENPFSGYIKDDSIVVHFVTSDQWSLDSLP